MKRVHIALTFVWLGLSLPTLLWWSDSVPWVAWMSLYANVVGHWSSYQGAKAQEAAEE